MKTIIICAAALWLGAAHAEHRLDSITCNADEPLAPASVVTSAQIAEDLAITETTLEAAHPLLPGKSLEEVIADEMKIIDEAPEKKCPLDFKKINQKNMVRPGLKIKNKRLVGSL